MIIMISYLRKINNLIRENEEECKLIEDLDRYVELMEYGFNNFVYYYIETLDIIVAKTSNEYLKDKIIELKMKLLNN